MFVGFVVVELLRVDVPQSQPSLNFVVAFASRALGSRSAFLRERTKMEYLVLSSHGGGKTPVAAKPAGPPGDVTSKAAAE